MKSIKAIVALYILIILPTSCNNKNNDVIELWYKQPASIWEEALPIGNGRLGAMIYGGVEKEHLQFNEETLWDGKPREYQRNDAHLYLNKIRQLLFEGKQDEAESLASEVFMGKRLYEDTFDDDKLIWCDSILQSSRFKEFVLPNCDDAGWDSMYIDGKSVWERNGLPDLDGSVLLKKNIIIPDSWINKDLILNLGNIKDQDFTYFNGHLIGSTDVSNTNRTYIIPKKYVNKGLNIISILINNYLSTGGLNAVRKPPYKMHIKPFKTKTAPLFIEEYWKYKVMDSNPPVYPQYEASYQPFGDITIMFPGHENYNNYKRSLSLNEAIHRISYQVNDVEYNREYLADHPDDLIALQFTASKKKSINFVASFESPHQFHKLFKYNDNTLGLSLSIKDGVMKGTALLNITTDGGAINVTDSSVQVTDANSATIKLIATTNYKSFKEVDDQKVNKVKDQLSKISDLTYNEIKSNHLNDYKPLFDRFSIDLGGDSMRSIPTDERIIENMTRPDNDLAATYVQYARYLMLSSGRPGTKPPNLQGIWNYERHPGWGSKYTTNINCEMNFWPVEPLNISECSESLFGMIEEVAESGEKTAKGHYDAKGWVLHHNTDQWRGTAPINNSNHGIWPTGGAWLCHHLWEHYLYSQDSSFLRNEAYPLIKGSVQFFNDFLIKDPVTGYLISTPSNSPEHGGLVAGPTMDHQIIRSLFEIFIKCSEILDTDKQFAKEINEKLKNIAPGQIGHMGQLQEWMQDIDDSTDTHRHVSHLWGVHPGCEITWDQTPDLMKAARQSLIFRGDDGTGWSLAWKINFWARFLDGEHAYKMIQMLLSPESDPDRQGSGGSYPNLFDAHPPFQIDGNFGGAAGITEMLVQSHQGYIQLLPALPKAWQSGSVKGLRVRGGFVMNMMWKNGQPTEVKIKSNAGNILNIKYSDQWIEKETVKDGEYIFTKWN